MRTNNVIMRSDLTDEEAEQVYKKAGFEFKESGRLAGIVSRVKTDKGNIHVKQEIPEAGDLLGI